MNCVACGTEIGDAAARCPSCGLVLAAVTDAPAAGDPEHVELYIGAAPSVVAAGDDGSQAASVSETPIVEPARTPLPPRARRSRAITWSIVVVAVAVAVVAIVRSRRPNDGWTVQEDYYAAFLQSSALRRIDVPAQFDPDAAVAAFERDDPAAFRAATAAHVPFVPAPGSSVHQVFDAFLPRLIEVAPRWSFHLGVHPHPHALPLPDATQDGRWLLLIRDLWRALHDGTDASRLSPHDRADREALLGWTEYGLRSHAVPDIHALETMRRCADPLVHLAEIDCCPATDRCDAASVVAEAIPGVLKTSIERLRSPPHELLAATARELDDVAAWLPTYPDAFAAAEPASRARLTHAIAVARSALADAAKLVRGNSHVSEAGGIGIGAEDAAIVLRVFHRLPMDARDVYEHALDEMRDAHDDMRRLLPDVRAAPEETDRDPDEVQIRGLRDACGDWVLRMPADAGLAVRAIPRPYSHRNQAASYLDPGAMLPADAGVVHIGAAPSAQDGFAGNAAALRRRHTLAHETYPGHRMEAVFRRSACALRRFVDDRVFVEGWAVYAEELLHETRRCSLGPVDDYVRAARRAEHASAALTSILVETGAAGRPEMKVILSGGGRTAVTDADIGERESPTLYAVDYFVGVDEIRRLRRAEEQRLGAAFDLRAFHAKLLAEGPIPPRLIEEEWRAGAR